jgi:hypothetical protein
METLCDKCLHKEICAIRDTHDEGDELAMTFCDNFKTEALIEMKVICEIDSLCIDTFGNFNHKRFIELKANHLNKCDGKRQLK